MKRIREERKGKANDLKNPITTRAKFPHVLLYTIKTMLEIVFLFFLTIARNGIFWRVTLGGLLVLASPQGGHVINGNATISSQGNQTVINQTSNKAILTWQSFNIGNGQTTHFQQPAAGIALNRINPQQGVSQIYGSLTATGRIILVNGAGIFFGPGSYVNVGGLIATTADITNLNFLNNIYHFTNNSSYSGSIINQGTIIAVNHGLVALIGNNIENNGLIQANLGNIVLASGNAFTITFAGNNLISFTVDEKSLGGINNTGTLRANGGQVLITADSASRTLDNVINLQGIVEVKSVRKVNGQLILMADGGNVVVSGKIMASGKKHGQTGGTVKILGTNNIALVGNAMIDVSGDVGGGTVLIGGNAHGAGPLPNANEIFMTQGATINANAITNGNGGNVVLWSNNMTNFYGNILAEGGAQSGNGGWVETSGGNLNFQGNVNASAPHGSMGSLLLDPTNIYIINGNSGTGDQDSHFTSGSLNFAAANTANNTVSVGELQSLGNINIILQATNSLTIGSVGGGSANVNLYNLTSGTLTLQAGNSTTVGGGNIIFNAGSALSTNSGNINIIAGDATTQKTGSAVLGAISTGSGSLTITAQQGVALNGALNTNSGALTIASNNGNLTQGPSGTLTVGNGNIILSSAQTSTFAPVLPSNINNLTLQFNNAAIVLPSLYMTGNLSVSAGGTISQSGTITTSNSTPSFKVSGASSDILLASYPNNFNSTPSVTGTVRDFALENIQNNASVPTLPTGLRNLTLNFANGIALPAMILSGNLNVTASNNPISQYGILNIAGTSIFNNSGGNADILLNSYPNIFNGAIVINGTPRDIAIRNETSNATVPSSLPNTVRNLTLQFDNANMALSGLSIGGNITAVSSGSITIGNLTTDTASTGTNNITAQQGITLTGPLTVIGGNTLNLIADSSGSGASIVNNGGSISISSGTLNLTVNTSGSDGIGTNSAPIQVVSSSGTVNVTAGTGGAYINSNGNFTLGNTYLAANSALSAISSGILSFSGSYISTGTGNLTLESLGGNLQTNNSLYTTTGNITLIGSTGLTVNGYLTTGSGAISLSTTGPGANMLLSNSIYSSGGMLTINSAAGLQQNSYIYLGSGTALINVETLGSGGANYNMNNSLTTTSTSSTAIVINVNQPSGGTGYAILNNLYTGTGGGLVINANNGGITSPGNNYINPNGTVTLSANTINLPSSDVIGASGPSGEVILSGANGQTIGIAGAAGSLQFSASFLAGLQAQNLRIGNGNSGLITIGQWAPTNTYAQSGVLTLDSGSGIAQTGALTLNNLLLRGIGNDVLNSNNAINNVAANLSSGVVSIINAATKALTITSLADDLGTASGITAPGGVSLTTSGVGGSLAVNQNIITTNAAVSLTGTAISVGANKNINSGSGAIVANAGTNALTLDSGSQLLSTGMITITADTMAFNTSATPSQIGGTGTNAGSAATVLLQTSTAGKTIGIAGGSGSLQLTVAALNDIDATNVHIGNSSAGNINSAAWTPAANFAANGVLTLDSSGTITENAAINLTNSGSGLLLRDASSVTLTANNIFSNIAATIVGSLSITNAANNTLTVATLTDDTGSVAGISVTGSNNINLANSGISSDININANVITASGIINAIAGRNIIINAGNLTTTNNVVLTGTTGTVTELGAGLINSAMLTTNSLGGTSLNNSNIISIYSGTNTASGNISITNNHTLTIASINQTVGNLSVINAGPISQTGALAVAGTSSFSAGANAIDLSNNGSENNFNGAVSLNNSGNNNISLTTSNALSIGTSSVGSGTLSFTSGGSISEAGALTQSINAGAITLTSTAGSSLIDISTQANNLNGTISIGGTIANIQDFKLRNINSSATLLTNLATLTNLRNLTFQFDNTGINLSALTLHNGGNLSLVTGGAITETGVLIVPGTASFNAGASPITLTQNNVFTGNVTLANSGNNNITLTNASVLNLGASNIGSGTLTLNSAGILQSGALIQSAGAGAVTINAGAGVINLINNDNYFTGSVSFNNNGTNNIALTNNAALIIGTSSIGNGTLALTANGIISETGPITQASGAGAITINENLAGSDVALNQANSLNGAITFTGTLSNIRDFTLRNINAGAVLPTNFSLTSLRNLTLQFDNNGIALPAITLTSGGSLTATAGGAITETGALTIPGTASFSSGANAITLTQNNAFTGSVTLTNSGNNNVAVTNAGALSLGASSVGSGTLILSSLGISQSGAIVQAAGAGAITINAGSGTISLANSGNYFTGAVSLNNIGTNNIQLNNSGALVLGASNFGGGAISLISGGTISETGPLVQAANGGAITLTLTAPSSDILLASQPNNFNGGIFFGGTLSNIRDVARRNVNATPGTVGTNLAVLSSLRNLTIILDNANLLSLGVTLHNGGNLYVDTSGSLSGGTGGNITQLGAITVPGTVTLIAGSHSINAAQNNNITGDVFLTNTGNNNVAMTTIGTLHIGNSSVGSGTFTLTGLGISQDGSITQQANAATVTINAGAGAIGLSNAGNSFTGPVSLNNSGANNIALVNQGALVLGASTIGTGTISLTSGGAITETGAILQAANAGAITLASTTPASNIDLSTAANDFSGTITFNGVLSNIQDFALRNIDSDAVLPANLVSLPNLQNLSLNFDSAGITFTTLTLQAGGSLSAIAGGGINQTGLLTVPGTASFAAGSHSIILTQNNNFAGNVTLTNNGNNNVSVTNSGLLSLGSVTVGSGSLILTGLGVTQTGAITQATSASDVTINAGAGMINLSNSANSFTGAVGLNNTGANDVQLTNTLPLLLAASNIGSGALSLTSGGSISQTGPLSQEANAGILTFTFTAPNADLLFGSQPNNITGYLNVGGNLSNLRDFAIWDVATGSGGAVINLLSLTNLRNLTVIYDNVPEISLPALTLHNGGSLVVNSSGASSGGTGGQIDQTGALVIPGTALFNAGSHAIILTQNNTFNGNVTLINNGDNNIALTNSNLLTIATSSVGSGTLTLTGLGITETGAITQAANAGAATMNAGAGSINLSNANNNFTGPLSLFNTDVNNVNVANVNALILGSSSIGTGILNITTSGNITESGSITQAAAAGNVTINANGNAINLTQDNDFTGAVSLMNSGANNVSLTNNDALALNTSTVGSGSLTIFANGPITQMGVVTQAAGAGAASFNANANAITLTLNNIFNGAVSFNNSGANNIALTNSVNLILGSSTIGTGTLAIIANGALTETGVITQSAGANAVSFNANANAITLTQLNSFTGPVSLINSGNNNISLINSGLLTIGTSTTGSGTLNLTGVGITQIGAMTQTTGAGVVAINAGTGLINLTNANNAFTGNVSLNNTGANNVALTNSAALTLGTSTVGSGSFTIITNGTLSQSGAMTQAINAGPMTLTTNAVNSDILLTNSFNNLSGALSFGGTLSNIRDVAISNINTGATLPTNLGSLTNLRNLTATFNNIGLTLPGMTLSGNLTVTAAGTIAQSGALMVAGTPTFTISTPQISSDLLLGTAANNFSMTPVITANGDIRDIALRNIAANAAVPTLPTGLRNLTLVFDNTGMTLPAMTLSGNLTVTGSGDISQSGALTVNTAGAVTTLNAGSNNIALINANNLLGTVAINSGNNVSLTNAANINFATSIISGNFTVNTNGPITQSGLLTVNGVTNLNVGTTNDITLNMSGNDFSTVAVSSGHNVTLTDANQLDLGAFDISGNLLVTTQSTLTQSGALIVSSAGRTATFAANSGNIILTNVNNNFTNLAINSGNDVSITDSNAINLATSSIAGNFNLTTNGTITQSGIITANGVGTTTTLNAGNSGDITLNLANNFATLAIPNARAVSLRDASNLTLAAIFSQSLTTTVGGNLTTTGLIQTAGGNVSLNTTDTGTITIGASGINTSTNQINPGGSIVINAANTASIATPITINGVLNTTGGSGGILTLGGGTQLNASPILGAGNINLNGNNSSQVLGNLTFNSAQVIAISNTDLIINGAITSTGIGSNLTFIADANNTGIGGVRATSTGSVLSSGTLTLQGSNLIVNPGISIELQAGSSLNAAGVISLLGNVGNSAILINGAMQSTGANQAITITPAGSGTIQLGANLSTNGGDINLSSRTQLINNVTLKTSGGAIAANTITGVGQTLTLDVGSGTDVNLTNANNNLGTVAITSGRNVQLANLFDIDLGASTISGNLSVTTGNTIANSGALNVAGLATFTSINNRNITLTQLNNDFTRIAIISANDVSLQNVNAIDLGPINLQGNLTITANGAITQNGGAVIANGINKTTTFAAGSANDITLNNAANDFTNVAITSGHNIILQNTSAVNLATVTIAGNLNVTTEGNITQSGVITLNGINKTVTLAAGSANDIILNNSANTMANAVITSGNNVTINNASAINFGASTINGNLNITSAGVISETAPLIVAGNSSFNAGGNAISLAQNNDFIGAVLLTNTGNNNIFVTNSGLLTIGAGISAIGSGSLTLNGLGITQSGSITQAANAGAVTINAGAGVINLGDTANIFTGPVSLNNNSGVNDVQLTNSIALTMGASNVGAGALTLTAGGMITETGAITQAANASTVTLSVTAPASDILLASQPNDFTGAIVYGGTLSNIRDIGRRNIAINAGLTTTNLDALVNLRNLTFILDNANIYAPAFTLHDGGNLYVDSSGALSGGTGGNIIQLGAATIPGTATLIAGNHAITADQNNLIGGAVTLSNSGNNNVIVTNSSALIIGSANVGSGTLTLNGAGVSQTGAITQAANAGTLSVNAGAGIINLSNSSNLFTGAIALNNSGANDVQLTNTLPLVLAASNIGSGALSLTSGGSISQTGPLSQEANAGIFTFTFTAPNSDLLFGSQPNNITGYLNVGGNLSNLRDVAIWDVTTGSGGAVINLLSLTNLRNLTIIYDNVPEISLPALTLHNGGSLVVNSSGTSSGGTGGQIDQTGALVIPGTSLFNAGSHAIILTQNNTFTGDVSLINAGNNNVAVTASNALMLNTSSVGSGTLTLTGAGVSQSGSITQAANAGAVIINAGVASIHLSNPGNSYTGPVSLFNSGANNIALVNNGALVLGQSTIGTGTLSLTSGGAITETGAILQSANAGAITLAATTANSNIDLSTAANNLSGTITFNGVLSNIQDFELRNIGSNATLPGNLTSLSDLRNLTLNFDNAGMTLPTLTLQAGGNLSVIAGGNINQTGSLSIPGTASFDAGTNRIILTQNNNFIGNVTLTNNGNNDVSVTNAGLLSLGSVSVGSGSLILTGLGVTQTAAITQAPNASDVTINAGAGMIYLGNSVNSLTGAVSLNNTGANDVQLTNTLPIVLAASKVGSGALSLTSGGNISQTGPLSQEANAGILTFTFAAPNSDLLFGMQANNITGYLNVGGNLGNLRDFAIWDVATGSGGAVINLLSLTNLRNLTVIYDNVPEISLPALTLHNGGSLVVNSSGASSGGTGGQIDQTGALVIPGTSLFNAGSHAIILTQNNTFGGAVTLINSGNNNISITSSNLLTIAASSVGSGAMTLTGLGITQTGAIIQEGNAGATIINAGSGAVSLGNASNSFTGPISFNNSGNNNVVFTNSGEVTLGNSSVGSGALSLTASGNMTETGGITQAANAGLITITTNSDASDIILNQANDLNGAILFGGNVSFPRNINLRNINAGATLPVNLAALSNLTNLSLSFDNTGVVLPALTLHNGGSLSVTTGGAILQSGVLTVPGTSSFNANANTILLTQNNAFNGAVTLVNSGNHDVAVTNTSLLSLASSSVGSGTLSLTGAGISQTGAISQEAGGGNVMINGGVNAINLSDTGNLFYGSVILNNSGDNTVALTNSTALSIGNSHVGSGALIMTAGGTISQTGAITQEANANPIVLSVTAPSSDILLGTQQNNLSGFIIYSGTLSNIHDVSLRNTNINAAVPTSLSSLNNLHNLTLLFDNANINFPTLSLSGDLLATAGGTLTQSGAISGVNLTTSSVGGTTLNSANAFSSFNASNITSGDIAYTNSAALLTIAGVNETNGNITLHNTGNMAITGAITTLGDDITLVSTGSINETGNGTLASGLLNTSSAGGASFTNDNHITAFNAMNSSGGNIVLVNTAEPLAINNITQLNGGNVSVTNTGTLSTNGVINTNGGDVTLATLSPDTTARVMTIGTDGIATTGGSINLNAANPNDELYALAIYGVLNTSPGTGGVFTLNPGIFFGAVPIVGSGNITLNGNGLDFVGGNLDISTTFVLQAPRNIILTGPITTSNGASLSLIADDNHIGVGGVLIKTGGSLDVSGALLLQGSNLSTAAGAIDPYAGVEIQTGSFVRSTSNISLLGTPGTNANIDINGNVQVTNPGSAIVITPAGLGVVNLGANVLAKGGPINLNGPVNVLNAVTVDSGQGGLVNFNNTVSGGSQTLSLQNNLSADGIVTFNNNVTLAGLTTFTQPYAVVFNGAVNDITHAITFNNTSGVTLGNGGDIVNFNGGLTSIASTTTLAGTVNTSGAPLTLNTITVAGNSLLNSVGGTMTLGAIDSNIAGTNSLAVNSGRGTINLNGIIGGTTPLANLTVTGNAIDINTNSITTSANQAYNGPALFNTDATLTAMNIAFNNGISGGHNLSLIGQPGNNLFTLTGPLSLNNVIVTGSANGNNALNVINNNYLSYLITGIDQGNMTVSGVTGLFNFARIHNLNGSIVVYANNPIPQPTPTTVTNRTEAEVARILSPYTSASIPVIHTVLPIDLFIIDSKTMPEVSDHLIISETVLSSPMNNQYYHLNTLAKTVTGTSRDIHSLSSSYPAESNVDVASTIMIIALFIALIMQIDLIAISTMLRFIKNIPANNLRLLARALTAANEKNIKTETAHPAEGMPINNSTDIAKLLEGGQLPEGYTISPFIIIPGTTASCIVTDPSRRIAIFTATGVKRKSTVNF